MYEISDGMGSSICFDSYTLDDDSMTFGENLWFYALYAESYAFNAFYAESMILIN